MISSPFGARSLNLRQHFGHPAPVLFVGSFQDAISQPGCAPRAISKDFSKRFIESVGFAALMRRVDAAVLARDFRQFNNFIGLGKTGGNVLQ